MKEIKTTVRVMEIEIVEKHREKTDKKIYKLKGTDGERVGKVSLELPTPFEGIKAPMLIDTPFDDGNKNK